MPGRTKVAIVTGASRGIGAACARRAAQAGYDVCVNYLAARAAAEAVVEDCRAAGRRAVAIQADVSDEKAVVQLFERAHAELGRATCLVNNAGILGVQAPLVSFSRERVRRVLEVNVLGAILCAREAIRQMSTRLGGAGGAIVNLSSTAAYLGSPHEYVDYAASKGAIDALTVGLSKEVAAEGIRVNAVRPGLIHTDMHSSGGEPERVLRLAASIPLGRGGAPEEVAALVLWLASDEASYVTGSIVNCAGGR